MSEELYTKETTCLYCHEKFNVLRVRSNKTKFIKRDSDFCPYYEGSNPLFYEVNVCPSCGLAYTDSFSLITKMKYKDDLKENYINKVTPDKKLNTERNIEDALKTYKLALYSATLLKEKDFIMANIALRIAWLYRYQNNETEEKRFMKTALAIYQDVYQNEDLDRLPMDKYLLFFLIGDLNGRLGNIQDVSRWFSIIIEDRSSTPKILKLTKERWQHYREMKEKTK